MTQPAVVRVLAETTTRICAASAASRSTGRVLRIKSQTLRMENRSLRVVGLRHLVRIKLRRGVLPYESAPRLFGGPGAGGSCGVCDLPLVAKQLVMAVPMNGSFVELHADCFMLWDDERRYAPARASS